MNVLVFDNQVAGTTDDPKHLYAGFTSHEVADGTPLDSLYFDGFNVVPIPAPPNDTAVWQVNKWVDIPPPVIEIPPKLADHELAPIVFEMLTDISPVLAEGMRYLLAKSEGDLPIASDSLNNLIKMATVFKVKQQGAIAPGVGQ